MGCSKAGKVCGRKALSSKGCWEGMGIGRRISKVGGEGWGKAARGGALQGVKVV